MKTDKKKLKEAFKEIVKASMKTSSYTDFKNVVSSLIAMYKLQSTHEEDNPFVSNIIEVLRNISYQSVLGKMADKSAEELLVLDENGNSTGKLKNRKAVHADGDWHREVAGIILRENGTFAIITRSEEKDSYGGAKGLVCGHVDGMASCHEAVVAECSQEVGTSFVQENFIRLMDTMRNEREDNKAFTTVYVVASELKEGVFLYQESEVDGVEWITVDKLRKYVSLSNDPKTEDMVIFKDNPFYRKLADSLELLFNLENWYDYLVNGDYETIHKHLGIKTPDDELAFYEAKRGHETEPAKKASQTKTDNTKK